MPFSTLTRIALAAALLATAAAPAAAQTGQKYAILVGVQKYSKSSGLADLSYTENDVEGLAKVLLANGYPEANVSLLTQKKALTENDVKFLPTRKNIVEEIRVRLGLLDEEDSILVAFAGHGLQFKGDKACYFCPTDAVIDDKETLVSLQQVYTDLESCKAKVKLVLCDACRNSPLAAGVRRAIVDIESVSRPQEIEPPGGVAALYSCSQGETAFENGELGHGVFFNFVIKGLKGSADFDKDRQIDLLELAKYTQKNVKDYVFAKYDRSTQVPQLLGTTRGLLPLLSLSGPIEVVDTWAVTVTSTPIHSGEKAIATAYRGDRYHILKEANGWAYVQASSDTEPQGWIQKTHLALEPQGYPGKDILVLWGVTWWPAHVLKREGEKALIRYYGHDSSWDEWIGDEEKRRTAVDRKITPYDYYVEWKEQYWPCRVLERQGDNARVEYVGFNSRWIEWVKTSRLSPVDSTLELSRQINADLAEK